ncbi:MAG: tetratricopeptide repeat protein [Leadbetterella sp.]|nr:tetratricopeptide repeat protein [Leadbetterella sp.]
MNNYVIKYQNANQTTDDVIKNFVVRKKEYEDTIRSIRSANEGDSFSHLVFVGRRGSGKSTLLRRIQAEILRSESLSSRYAVVNLSEEQSGIYRFFDLWDYVIRDMNSQGFIIQEPDFRLYKDNLRNYSKDLHGLIVQALRNRKKQLILLIDNIDRIFDNIGEEVALFRELLMNFKEIRIIGGSTVMSEHFWRYDLPFYEYFTIKRIEPLTIKEIEELLKHWSKVKGVPEIKDYLKIYPGKIHSIRMLTDGLPRTMLLFIDMLLDRKQQNGYQYLQKIVDNATPIYQERLFSLSASQRKVITELAFLWDAITVEGLVDKCKMESKLISAILNQLVGLRFVEKIKGETKNRYYRLEERFFNLWLNMTQGGPQQRYEAKALSSFLESWYDKTELENLVKEVIDVIYLKKPKRDYVESMGNALMKCKSIAEELKRALALGLIQQDLKISDNDIVEIFGSFEKAIGSSLENKDYETAIRLLGQSNIDYGLRYFGLALSYEGLKDTNKAKEFYEKAVNKNYFEALTNLGNLYVSIGDVKSAKEKYLLGVESGVVLCMNNLGNLYKNNKEFELAEKYYKMAIERGSLNTLNNLGELYSITGREDLARGFFLKAIENEAYLSAYSLGQVYHEQRDLKKAKEYYQLAYRYGNSFAANNLGVIFEEEGEQELAETKYLEAIGFGDLRAFYNLGLLFAKRSDIPQARYYFNKAIDSGFLQAYYELGLSYDREGDFDRAELFYKKGVKANDERAMNNLGVLYLKQKKFDLAQVYYSLAVEKGVQEAKISLAIIYYFFNDKEKLKQILDNIGDVREQGVNAGLLMVFDLYLGDTNQLKKMTETFFAMDMSKEDFRWLVVELLVHHQKNLIFEYFSLNSEVKVTYKPLYYALLHLLNDKETIKMPPEIEENVNDILKEIAQKQEYYYPKR